MIKILFVFPIDFYQAVWAENSSGHVKPPAKPVLFTEASGNIYWINFDELMQDMQYYQQ